MCVKETSTAAIIGIIIGSIAGAFTLFLLCYCAYKHKNFAFNMILSTREFFKISMMVIVDDLG